MITGDHVQTASAIAKQIGILQPGQKAITGKELDAMSDQELDNQVDKIGVYARVSPENKIRIVKSWQRKGDVVAMTGDGVNDAPALKAADIGAAMGITGTDVAKSAADMTLTDDNFATIIAAVKEGRGIYNNIKNVVGYLLGTNIGEVVCVFMVMLLWKESALLSMQLLWVNLVTDSLPAVALGMEPVDESVMSAKPKPKNESLFAHGFGVRIVLMGIMFGVLPMIGFKAAYIQTAHLESAQTLAFMVLALSQVVQSYNMRSEKSLLKIGFFSNKKLNGACLLSLVLVLFVLFTPGVMSAFGFVYLSAKLYLLGLVLVLVPLVIMEFSKAFGLIKHQK
jgi:Ca2+-transporting ATPase